MTPGAGAGLARLNPALVAAPGRGLRRRVFVSSDGREVFVWEPGVGAATSQTVKLVNTVDDALTVKAMAVADG